MQIMRIAWVLLFSIFLSGSGLKAQFVSFGTTLGVDLYQHISVPSTELVEAYSTGSALVNINFGPKIWFGKGKTNFSLEAQASYAPFAYDTKDYKGLGALSFPLIGSLNFNGVSTTQSGFGTGFSVGGGVLYTNADLYFLSDDYGGIPRVDRLQYFPAYFGQVAFGGGGAGLAINLYVRYGVGPDNAAFFSTGIMMNINSTSIRGLKKVPESIQD
jgi:hypothetical protein